MKDHDSHFISRKGQKLTVRVRVTGRQKQTKDCYVDPYLLIHVIPYSGPHLQFLLLGWRALSGCSHDFMSACLDCVTDRYSCGYLHIWLHNAKLFFRLSTLVIRFRLSASVSCLLPHITIFLFTQLEHDSLIDGSVKVLCAPTIEN